ncbi:MAG: nitrite reductase large subunit [Omnitrophica bacterium RIFCSPLOWO2_12_FULL_44_17]|uniref:Nitrite reductase large subunit n=1 Tax=Candidatus Danuiimicrobium aquiferis TaxID=1801832 RepID=A0A1G1L2A8_9BACT|nr:MAG: nitrite reductase large subunit [Omnitrophica bacterium RIFCSPHIGHO2_02_FULL_45_28]OGW99285.1 MAG: nitrite reductase large subunit [Omnitrophica bacterium RIFCSPLOWO2_12_FULL_44_17]
MKKKIVVIGNGMAGARIVQEILSRDSDLFEFVMFGAEPYGNYNRILLSNVLNQTQEASDIFINPLSWFEENKIKLYAGCKVVKIDTERKVVLAHSLPPNASAYAVHDEQLFTGEPFEESYDHVIIATGSRPFVPPMEGFDGEGTFLFRTIDDCHRIAEYAKSCRRAVVIGGGLLGLEAARGLMTHNVEVTVIEAAGQLMPAQLDIASGQMLMRNMETLGITVLTDHKTAQIHREGGKVHSLVFTDGATIPTDMVIVSAGIRPITEVAHHSGLTVNKGILCNDQMRTSDPSIYALGECVEHRGKLYGLVEPIWQQAFVLADVLTGFKPNAVYEGSKTGTKLKVMGVDLMSLGEKEPGLPGDEVIVYREPNKGVYKKLIVRDNKLYGAILLGDADAANVLLQMFFNDQQVPENRSDLLFGEIKRSAFIQAVDLPDHAQICKCNGVNKKTIVDAIDGGAQTVAAVGGKTKAGKGCGSCRNLIAQIIEAKLGKVSYDPSEHYYVPGIPLEKSQLVAMIRAKSLKSVSAVFTELTEGKEDPDSKPGLASLLKILWPKEYEDERDARFINDRVHANIQKDGTFSVIPRIYGGVTSAKELLRIARAAVKYSVKMVKLTGGQRIDLLGVKKNDLPKAWKDLGMTSGHAYSKSFRTCKSCVGTDFCRYGIGDSIALAQKIERRFQGIESPHKLKLATAGCPRNCSEAYVKDIGAVAIEGDQWEIYVGGAAGGNVRKGDLLCTVNTHEEVLRYTGRFMEYYREHAKYTERSYGFVERIKIDVLHGILVKDSLGICAQLDERIQKAVDSYKDPWLEGEVPAYPAQFEGPQLAQVLKETENNS